MWVVNMTWYNLDMKILIPSDLYWPTINGVSTFSRTLALGLAKRGHQVVVIAPSQTGKKHIEMDGNYKIVRTASVPFPFYQKFKISVSPYREVKRVINEFQPDVIHIQMLMMIGQAAMRHGNKLDIPIVSTNHAIPENLMDNLKLLAPVARPISYMLKRYGTRFHSKADYVTLPTQSAIDMFGSEVERITVPIAPVSNGIDLSRFHPAKNKAELRKKYKLTTDLPVIAYVGRVDSEKHIHVLMRAFMQVLEQTKAHLLIVGDGTEMADLRELVDQNDLMDDVTFTGRVSDEDLVALHRVGDVYCMPSPAELQSIATLEAMASGMPIVAVDAGALRELCQDGRNGYLCRKDDVDQIATSLLKIITDKKLRVEFGKQSLEIAKTHDLEYSLDRFEAIYREVIESRNV
jgi:1,2-diacylglycerol 3-alpha-glucosyltransferase